MTTQTLEAKLSLSAAVRLQEQNVGNNDVDQASAVMPAVVNPQGRRCEGRMDYRCMCSYEVLRAIAEELFVIKQRNAFVLNRSTEGLLLFMALAPHAKQLIEVHAPRSEWGRTANVFEVRWARSVQVESFGNLCLVGCRLIFNPCHYLPRSSSRSRRLLFGTRI